MAEKRFLSDAAHHGQHGAAPTKKGEGGEEGHIMHRQSRRARGEGVGEGAQVMGYALR